MHTKHSNTFFPGDRVKVIGSTLNKIASNETGKVVGGDPDTGRLKVAFSDGREDWASASDLVRSEG